jgi:hypothetical protein
MKHYTPKHRERLAIFADIARIQPTILRANNQFYLPDIQDPLYASIKKRLYGGLSDEEFEKLSLEEKSKFFSRLVVEQKTTLEHLIKQVGDSSLRSFGRKKRVKFDKQGQILEDDWLTLGSNLHISVGHGTRLDWNTFINLIDAQRDRQNKGADEIIDHSRVIVQDFQKNPRCETTTQLFTKIGRAFAEPVIIDDVDDEDADE